MHHIYITKYNNPSSKMNSSKTLSFLLLILWVNIVMGSHVPEKSNKKLFSENINKCTVYHNLSENNSSSSNEDNAHQNLRRRAKRITAGLEGDIAAMPWLIYLAITDTAKNGGSMRKFGCTGSLISPRHVLTNAHCLQRVQPFANNTIVVAYGSSNHSQGVKIVLDHAAVHLHPNFTSTTTLNGTLLVSKNDLAILDLGQELEFGDNVHSICLGCLNNATLTNGTAIIAGWGNMAGICFGQTPVYPDVFRYDIVTLHPCLTRQYVIFDRVCTQADLMHGIGGGDSGGPVLSSLSGDSADGGGNGPFLQVGVNGGNNCLVSMRENSFDKIDGEWINEIAGVKCRGYDQREMEEN